MAKIDRVQEISIDLLKPYENNAKLHGDEQIQLLKKSIQEFGFISPMLIDENYNLIAGHGRLLACKELGITSVPCVFIEGLTETQRKAYILADNRLTELGEWNESIISSELSELQELGFDINLTGFTIDDITFTDEEDYLPDVDANDPTTEIAPRIHRGEVWILGDHRLMCGDSTNYIDISKLMDGELADLVETDPPYNVDVHNSAGESIENDNLSDHEFEIFINTVFSSMYDFMKDGGVYYIWHGDSNGHVFRNALENNGLKVRQNIIWVKSHFTFGRQDYQWRHEPCLYGWKDGAGHYFIDMRSLSTVIEYDTLDKMSKEEILDLFKQYLDNITTVMHEKVPAVNDLHPTMKPLSLIKKQIRNSSREGEIVLDLFGGSGTTLIACEDLNRKCRMMEFDPKYADRIISRWEQQTGKHAVKKEY